MNKKIKKLNTISSNYIYISFPRCLNGTYLPPPLKQILKRKAQLKSNIWSLSNINQSIVGVQLRGVHVYGSSGSPHLYKSKYKSKNQDQLKKNVKIRGVYVWTPPKHEKSTVVKKYCPHMPPHAAPLLADWALGRGIGVVLGLRKAPLPTACYWPTSCHLTSLVMWPIRRAVRPFFF